MILHRQLSPDELLTFAVEDTEIYEICKANSELRQSCIVAAVRRYHTEKFFYEEVYNRTADYVVILDHFLQIEDEYEKNKIEKGRFKYFPWCHNGKRDRQGDAAKNGGD